MSNYYLREDGLWFICEGDLKIKCDVSGSMEIAYQMGVKDAQSKLLEKKENPHQKLAEEHVKRASKLCKELSKDLDALEKTLREQNKPSESLGW